MLFRALITLLHPFPSVCFVLGAIPGTAQGPLPALCSGLPPGSLIRDYSWLCLLITRDGVQGTLCTAGNITQLTARKASALFNSCVTLQVSDLFLAIWTQTHSTEGSLPGQC